MQDLSLSSYTVYIVSANEALLGRWERIGVEHLFLAICKVATFDHDDLNKIIQYMGKGNVNVDEVQGDFDQIRSAFSRMNIEPNETRYGLRKSLGRGKAQDDIAVLHRSEQCRQIYKKAGQLARETGATTSQPIHLLWAILQDEDNIPVNSLKEEGFDINQLISICKDVACGEADTRPTKEEGKRSFKSKSKTKLLDKIGRDITAMAAEGKLPLVIGRKEEIRHVIQGLLRADKNGVVLIGDPGVGKTCVVEGLAQFIASDRLPDRLEILKGKQIIEVSGSALLAGTKYRGEFEERMEQIIKECEENKDSIILFVDEIHTLMGAGKGGDGAMDAGNIMKPALSRGRINLVGATTTDEYTRFIEKDGAIDRRLIKVYVNEPTKEETLKILAGLREQIESQYGIQLQEEAIKSAVDFSVRYLPERRLPDKAVDIIHQACANKLCSGDMGSFWDDPKSSRGIWTNTDKITIESNDIAMVISGISKIPVSKIIQSPDEQIAVLQEALSSRIIGQDEAVETVCRAVRAGQLGLTEKHRPDGVFFLLGPTGVGKTELAKAVADILFYQSRDQLIRIDMSEFQEKHQISKLIGAAPGYVGYDQEGMLTGAVRKNPYSVVLFDEVEKAHTDIFDLFLQIFDDGQLTDSHGRRADFSNTMIFLTSNLGTAQSKPMGIAVGDAKNAKDAERESFRQGVMKEVKKWMRPEIINRIDHLIFFHYLEKDAIKDIAHKIIEEHKMRFSSEHQINLILTEDAFTYLVDRGYNRQYGVRELKRVIEKSLIQTVTNFIFDNKDIVGTTLICDKEEEKGLKIREE